MVPLFSFDGRIRRKDFWITNLIVTGIYMVVYFIVLAVGVGGAVASSDAGGDPSSGGIMAMAGAMGILGLLAIPVMIVALSLNVRRWHDLNKSGWMTLLSFVPLVNIYAFIMTGFIEGTVGPNQYGEDPKAAEHGMATSPVM